jgi:glycosyltransferase involved in cell wall biosynthesis
MSQEYPLVSIIMATYNREKTIERAIASVLKQTYTNFELIIVDDGSTDNTNEVLNRFADPRIRIFKHQKNKGVSAAKNTGLREIKGEWFTTFDSDDEMIPEAIETLVSIPLYFDRNITAVTCNGLNTSTKNFVGKGLTKDQYLDVDTLMTSFEGDFWGLTKTSLLMNDRFNENICGLESVLWYKIDERANRYYIHRKLLIVHTEGQDRISNARYDLNKEIRFYTNLIDESHYLNKLKKYFPNYFLGLCRTGLIITRLSNNKNIASQYYEYLNNYKKSIVNKIIYNYWLVAFLMNKIQIVLYSKPYLKVILK